MKIILFVLLFISTQIEVYAQQKQAKKSWGTRATPVEVIKAKKTKLYSLTPSYGRIISLEPYSLISKINEEVKIIHVLEGAEVVKGQKLIELENKNIKRLIARYEAEILYSEKNLKFLNEELSIVNDKVYSPTFSDKLLVYDINEGSKIWELKISSINQVIISGEALYIIDTLGKLLCLDSKTGRLLWSVQLKTNYDGKEIRWFGPLLTSNKLLVANSFGTILSLSPFTGKTLSKLNMGEEFILSPFQIKNEVLFITKKGTILILG